MLSSTYDYPYTLSTWGGLWKASDSNVYCLHGQSHMTF